MGLIRHFREVTRIQFRRIMFDADVAYSDIKNRLVFQEIFDINHDIKQRHNSLYLYSCVKIVHLGKIIHSDKKIVSEI